MSYAQMCFHQFRHHFLPEINILNSKCDISIGFNAQKMLKISPHDPNKTLKQWLTYYWISISPVEVGTTRAMESLWRLNCNWEKRCSWETNWTKGLWTSCVCSPGTLLPWNEFKLFEQIIPYLSGINIKFFFFFTFSGKVFNRRIRD